MDHVALLDRIDDGLAFQDLAEDGVAAVQPIGLDVGDEELAAVGVRAGVGHRQRADLMLHAILFVFELVARAPVPRPCGQPPWIMKSAITRWKIRPS